MNLYQSFKEEFGKTLSQYKSITNLVLALAIRSLWFLLSTVAQCGYILDWIFILLPVIIIILYGYLFPFLIICKFYSISYYYIDADSRYILKELSCLIVITGIISVE